MTSGPAESATSRGEIHNEAHRLSSATAQALKSLRDLQMEALGQEQRLATAVRPGSELQRGLNAELARWVTREIPDARERVAKIAMEYEANFDKARLFRPPAALYDLKSPDVVPHPPPPVLDGEFWWANTDFYWPFGLGTAFLTDGLHFFGGIGYNEDPLIYRSAGAVAHFELQASRRPPTASGRYASAPIAEIFGKISGFTNFYHFFLAADDKWCKCWLHLRQTALQLVPHDFGAPGLHAVEQPVVLASRGEVKTLIDEENSSRWVDAFLQGFTPMPPIEFGLVNPNLSIWVQLEFRFDIQLEGSSAIRFSPEPNPMGSVVLRHPQWRIQSL